MYTTARAAPQFMSMACNITMHCVISSDEIFQVIWKTIKFIFKHLNANSMNDQIFKWEDIEF